ncbi:MAG: hypothetical protein Q7K26_06865 [bacterium]|nr:hypothetical protein [bacterium]
MEEKKRHPILKILLLDIGVAGSAIFGALGIIAIAFIALNYFNILSLSDLYPKLLPFLPRQTTNQTPPKPILPQQNISDLASLNKSAQEFADNILLSPYKIKVSLKKGMPVGGNIYFPDTTASYSDDFNNISFRIRVSYDKNKKPLDMTLSMFPLSTQEPISSASATVFASRYIKLPSQDMQWSCLKDTRFETIQCDTMTTQTDNRKVGISITANTQNESSTASGAINTCQIFPNSNMYSWSTCLHK